LAVPPKAQSAAVADALERSGKRTGKRLDEAFLAGERPAPSGSTEGASGRLEGVCRQSLR
jgi:hypothetical protein